MSRVTVRVSGAVCGHTWMPQTLAGMPAAFDIEPMRRRLVPGRATIRETLESWLCENGGDFQFAQFTPDTEIIFEFRKPTVSGYEYHCRVRSLADCPSMADYVADDVYAGDFL